MVYHPLTWLPLCYIAINIDVSFSASVFTNIMLLVRKQNLVRYDVNGAVHLAATKTAVIISICRKPVQYTQLLYVVSADG